MKIRINHLVYDERAPTYVIIRYGRITYELTQSVHCVRINRKGGMYPNLVDRYAGVYDGAVKYKV